MSADNFATCPQCEKSFKDTGVRAGNTMNPLREDWDIGTDENGNLHVEYRCKCKTCGFSLEFNHIEQLEIK